MVERVEFDLASASRCLFESLALEACWFVVLTGRTKADSHVRRSYRSTEPPRNERGVIRRYENGRNLAGVLNGCELAVLRVAAS